MPFSVFLIPFLASPTARVRTHALQLTDVTCYVLRFNALSISAIERNT